MHPAVIDELALGSIADRATVLEGLEQLRRFPVLSHAEVRALVDRHQLWGHGLSTVDAHLLGSTAIVAGARLWTRDRRLGEACVAIGVSAVAP